jgi:hypothetical protein
MWCRCFSWTDEWLRLDAPRWAAVCGCSDSVRFQSGSVRCLMLLVLLRRLQQLPVLLSWILFYAILSWNVMVRTGVEVV